MARVHIESVTCEKQHDKIFRGRDEMRLLVSTDRDKHALDIRGKIKKGEQKQINRTFEFDRHFSVEVREVDPKKENKIGSSTINLKDLFPMPQEETPKEITLDSGRARYSVKVRIYAKDQEFGKY
jgi:hypothetical protein